MADIEHEFPIKASAAEVFAAASTAKGLSAWWSLECEADPREGGEYVFDFGPGYRWKGRVTRFEPDRAVEWEMTEADADWRGTRVGVELAAGPELTQVSFHHRGWPDGCQHRRVSTYCWAMYLRLLRRFVLYGEVVPYSERLEA